MSSFHFLIILSPHLFTFPPSHLLIPFVFSLWTPTRLFSTYRTMVFSTPRRVRGRIDFIWDNLIIPATGIKDDRHLSDDVLQRFQIQQVTQFNFENLDSIPISISQTPPILIQPMPLGELQSLVVDEVSLSDLRPFRDFDSSKAGQYGWEVDSCTESIRNNVEDWATSPSMRPIPFSADGFGLVFPTRRGLSPIA